MSTDKKHKPGKPGEAGQFTVRLTFDQFDHLRSVAEPNEAVAQTLVRCMMQTSGDRLCYVYVRHAALPRPGRMGPYSPMRAVQVVEAYRARPGWTAEIEVHDNHVVPSVDPNTVNQREDEDED